MGFGKGSALDGFLVHLLSGNTNFAKKIFFLVVSLIAANTTSWQQVKFLIARSAFTVPG
jgi:hypothetical protein